MLTGTRQTGGDPRILNRGGGAGIGDQPGGVWVKVLPCDTHREAPKILERGGILPAAKDGRVFFLLEKKIKSGFLYIPGGQFLKNSLAALCGWFFWREAKNFDRGVKRGAGPGWGEILARTGGGGAGNHRLSQGGEHV